MDEELQAEYADKPYPHPDFTFVDQPEEISQPTERYQPDNEQMSNNEIYQPDIQGIDPTASGGVYSLKSDAKEMVKPTVASNPNLKGKSTIEVEGFMPMLQGEWNNFRNLFNTNVSENVYYEPKGIGANIAKAIAVPTAAIAGGAAAIAALPFELPIIGGSMLASTVLYNAFGGAAISQATTLLDHYEREAANIHDELSASDVALSGVEGAVYGGPGGAVAGKLLGYTAKAIDPILTKFSFKNKNQLKSAELAIADNKVYNPETDKAHDLVQTTEPVELPKIKYDTDIKDETLDKLKLTSQSKILNEQEHKDAILRAQQMHDAGFNLDDLPTLHTSIINETHSRFTQMIDDFDKINSTEKTSLGFKKLISEHMLDPSNNVAVRHAVGNELNNLTDYDIKSGSLYNQIVGKAQDEKISLYKELGKDIGKIDGYIPQQYDPNRVKLLTKEQFADLLEPNGYFVPDPTKANNAWDRQTLYNMYENIVLSDYKSYGQIGIMDADKSRKWFFNDVKSAMAAEEKIGYKKFIGSHLSSILNSHANDTAMIKLFGTADYKRVAGYLGQIQGKAQKDIERVIKNLEPAIMHAEDTISNAIGTIQRALITTSRGIKAATQPLHTTGFYARDTWKTLAYTWGKYGNAKAIIQGMFGSIPKELEQLANLNLHQAETFSNIIGTLKETGRNDLATAIGVGRRLDNTGKYLTMANRASLKLNGAHILDGVVRRQSTRATAFVLRESYKHNQLSNILPKADENILKQAIDKDGFVVPNKLLDVIDKTTDLTLKQQYRDHFNQLTNLYSSVMNDINPIYSNGFKSFDKLPSYLRPIASASAWFIRSTMLPYGNLLKQIMGSNNRIRSGTAIIALGLGDAALEMAGHKLFSYLKGDEKENKHVKDITKKINDLFDTDLDSDDALAIELAMNAANASLPILSIYNSNLYYGPAKYATQATMNMIEGNDYKAEKNLEKAFPYLQIFVNQFGDQ